MKRIALFICVLICMVIFGYKVQSERTHEEDFNGYTAVTVSVGDVLWDLAQDYCPNDFDKRAYIELIKKANSIQNDKYIHPGQTLIFPIITSEVSK